MLGDYFYSVMTDGPRQCLGKSARVCRHMLQVGSSLLSPPSQAVMLEHGTFQMTKGTSSAVSTYSKRQRGFQPAK